MILFYVQFVLEKFLKVIFFLGKKNLEKNLFFYMNISIYVNFKLNSLFKKIILITKLLIII